MARTVYGDHPRYLKTYMQQYPGYYFTGDGAYLDQDGYVWISGRVDDVINKAGHRLGTAEIESALVTNSACAESAVIAIADDLKGQAIIAFCVLADGFDSLPTEELVQALRLEVRAQIGPIATPDRIVLVHSVPKTRSGKVRLESAGKCWVVVCVCVCVCVCVEVRE
jgi:acetyl-CoA synthetase